MMNRGYGKAVSYDKGLHGQFEFEYLLQQAIENIKAVSLYKHKYANEYANAVEFLYSLWIPKAMKDEKFLDEVKWYMDLMENKISLKPKNEQDAERLDFYMNYQLPMRNADMIFRAVMKSIERKGLLPREKVAIEI